MSALVAMLLLSSPFEPLKQALPEHAKEIASLDLPTDARACAAFYVVAWTGPVALAKLSDAELARALAPFMAVRLERVEVVVRPYERRPGDPICDPDPAEECSCGHCPGGVRHELRETSAPTTQWARALLALREQRYDDAMAIALLPQTWAPRSTAASLLEQLRALRKNPKACR